MNRKNEPQLSPDIKASKASDLWLSIAHQRLASYHVEMTSSSISRSSERFAELSCEMRAEARVLEHLSKLFVVQWNADASGIHSLPPEILHYIFSLDAEMDRPRPPYDCRAHDANNTRCCRLSDNGGETPKKMYPQLGRGGDIGWLRLGHVCRSWRSALLGLPALWASDVGLLPRGLHEMLERCQETPLNVKIYISRCRPEAVAVLAALFNDSTQSVSASRVKELDILDTRDSEDCLPEIDAALEASTFPLLERATIFVNSADELVRPLASLPVIRAPKLHTLSLVKVFYPWSSTVLTDLDIGAFVDGTDPGTEPYGDMEFEAGHLLFILRTSASTIERLTLTRCAFSDAAGEAFERRPVNPGLFARSSSSTCRQVPAPANLPNLRHLHLRTSASSGRDWDLCSRFLASIALSTTARLTISARLYEDFVQEAAQNILAGCLSAGRQICDLDGLAISDRPILEYHDVSHWKQTSFSFYSSTAMQNVLQSDQLHAEPEGQYPVRLVFEDYLGDDLKADYDREILGTLLRSSILSQVTTMAFLNREPFWFYKDDNDSSTERAVLTSFLPACARIHTLFIRLPNAYEYAAGHRSLLDILCEGPVLPRLKHLSLHGRVVLAALPEQLYLRSRSLREAGHASKLLELRLKVDEDRVRRYRDDGGDMEALSSTLHEYADSVDIRA